MIISMSLKTYLNFLRPYANKPLSLDLLGHPFRVQPGGKASNFLLVGHLLDEMAESMASNRTLDVFDVAAVAWDLGYEAAGEFLEDGPYLLFQLICHEGSSAIR